MASQPVQNPALPLFYGSIVPLSSQVHADFGLKPRENFAFASATHAVPLTVDEFAVAQRFFPVVFGVGEGAAPLALMGLQEGQNQFVDGDGNWRANTYVPAYARRHPFILARLTEEAQELSLCFDEDAGMVTADAEAKLFDGGQPSEVTKGALAFCEQFEQAVARTRSFMDELEKLGLLMDGEVTIQMPGQEQPAIYRGFRMVNEEKLQNIRGDQARKMVQNGMMGLIYAHLFSLSEIKTLFEAQFAPQPQLAA